MSNVTDVVLMADDYGADKGNVERLNDVLRSGARGHFLVNVESANPADRNWYITSGKVLQVGIWIGALNHLDCSDLLEAFHAMPWARPTDVVLVLHGEDFVTVARPGRKQLNWPAFADPRGGHDNWPEGPPVSVA